MFREVTEEHFCNMDTAFRYGKSNTGCQYIYIYFNKCKIQMRVRIKTIIFISNRIKNSSKSTNISSLHFFISIITQIKF